MTPQERLEFEQMKAELNALKSDATIPWNVEQAFRTRLQIASSTLTTSAKGNQTESIPVNTAAGTQVQLFPDGFLQTQINGTTVYIAYYT